MTLERLEAIETEARRVVDDALIQKLVTEMTDKWPRVFLRPVRHSEKTGSRQASSP